MMSAPSKAAKGLPDDLMDELLAGYQKPEDLVGENGLLKQPTKAIVERALQAEIANHLGHALHENVTNSTGNARNGESHKPSKASLVNCPFKSRVTVMAVSNLNLSLSTKRAGQVLMTRSSHYTPVA